MRIPGKHVAIALGLAVTLYWPATAQDILPPPVGGQDLPAEAPIPQPDPALQESPAPGQGEKVQREKDDYKNDWRQAGDGDGRLDDRLRSHIVRLNDKAALTGVIAVIEGVTGDLAPIEDIKIRFILRGEVKATAEPRLDGSFTVRDLKPGVYSMIAAGKEGFLAWSVNIQPSLADQAKMTRQQRARFLPPQVVKSSLVIEAAAVPPTNFVPLKSLLRGYLPSEEGTLYIEGTELPDEMPKIPPENARSGTGLKHHQVRLSKDGRLLGRIRRLEPDTGRDLRIRQLNVFLLKDNQNIAQEPVAPNGTFAFDDLRPGVYSMVAAGRDGFLAFSIDVLNPASTEATVPNPRKDLITAAYRVDQDLNLAIDIALCPPEDLNPTNVDAVTDNFRNGGDTVAGTDAPAGFGSPAGGSFGGGAPFGGAPAAAPPGGGGVGGGVGGGIGGSVGAGPAGGLGGILVGAVTGGVIAGVTDDEDGGIASPSSPGISPPDDDGTETELGQEGP